MPFPSHLAGLWQPSSPILVTATSTVSIPSRARVMHAFIVGGGGAGGAAVAVGGATGGGCGGAAGGSLYARIDLRLWRGDLPLRSSRADSVTLTIGNGGTGVSRTVSSGGTPGNPGGTTTLSMPGTVSFSVTGGDGGTAGAGGPLGTPNPGASPTSYVITRYAPTDAVLVRPLVAVPMAETADGHTGNSAGATGGAVNSNIGAESAPTSGTISSSILLPWWLQAVGLNRGAAGTGGIVAGQGRAASGGAGGFAGNGGNGAVSNTVSATATAGAGYGSGGGGASTISSQTATSGAGAPGCAVLMFELEV